jgi:hypothetical protein
MSSPRTKQDRGSVEDASPYGKVGIDTSYQRFLIAPFVLVKQGFTQLQKIFEGFEKCRVSRLQGGNAGSNPVGDTRSNPPLTRPDTATLNQHVLGFKREGRKNSTRVACASPELSNRSPNGLAMAALYRRRNSASSGPPGFHERSATSRLHVQQRPEQPSGWRAPSRWDPP